jgi:hypothetical protein
MLTGLSNRRSRRGQAALFMTMTLTLSFGLIGLVVDLGWAYWRQEACLEAAQSAAMGGIMFALAPVNAPSSWPPATCNSSSAIICQATATACPTNLTYGTQTTDVKAACVYAQANGFMATGKQTVTIAANTGNPPTAGGVSTAYYITARVTEQVPLTFLAVIAGRTSSVVAAVATAGVISTPAGDCVYVLDPSGAAALNASNGVSVQSECGFWINSSNTTNALSVTGGSTLAALDSSTVNVVGITSTSNGGNVTPTPTRSSPALDPFLTRDVPLQRSVTSNHPYACSYGSTGGCAHTSTGTYVCDHGVAGGAGTTYNTGGSTVTLNPGVWCGGITIGNVSTVTFNPGVYILDGGGLSIGQGGGVSSATGTGVTFYSTGTNTGSTSTYRGITITNGVTTVQLSAPTSGSMAGLVYYQDPSLTTLPVSSNTTSIFAGGVSPMLAGSIYLPNTAINFSNGTSSSTASVGMVVYDAVFTGGAYFKHDGTNITSLGGTTRAGMVQ